MPVHDSLSKLRANRSVLERTRPVPNLPKLVLYVEWLAGQMRRRVLDTDGQSHEMEDAVLLSNYKLVTGGKAKDLVSKHWPQAQQDQAAQSS